MTPGKSKLALGVVCALAAVVVATPTPASAAVDEYTLGLDTGGNDSGGEEESSAAPVPAYPTYTAPTYETFESDATAVKKKRKSPEELAPALATSSANATLGPAKTPRLAVGDGGRSVPTGAILLAVLAGICCVLAVWRLRFLRELPAAPRRRAPRSAI